MLKDRLLAAGNEGSGTGSHELHPDADQEKADEFAENGHTEGPSGKRSIRLSAE